MIRPIFESAIEDVIEAARPQHGPDAVPGTPGEVDEDSPPYYDRTLCLLNTRENVRLTFDHKVDQVIQEIVDPNFDLCKRIPDDRSFGGDRGK